ncbi:peptidylprolyl isomerase [Candidatus Saccharibacteria bacterium]|nr:peptidylprolyl isomerase [Candidatus Saccharibacteria bacterium]
MKKFLQAKLKAAKKQEEPTPDAPERVTNQSVDQHRDEVLSRGRKFKYPFQHSKHRVALTSLVIVVASLLVLSLFTGYQLYRRQSTGDFTYRVTQIIPFPVAKVNGNFVSYERYLFELRPNIYWLSQYGTTDLQSPDGKRQIEHYKNESLKRAMENTVAADLAKANNITVTDKEVDASIDRVQSLGGDLDQVVAEEYNFSVKDFRRLRKEALIRLKVAKALDKEAPKHAQKVLNEIKAGKPFADAAKEYSDDLETKQLGGDVGVVEKGKAKLREEVAAEAFKLEAGAVSGVIETENGDYYIIKVNEKLDENRVKISMIRIAVKDMSEYVAEYEKAGKVSRYITPTPNL